VREVEVLVVGAGPAGIGAAAETTRHGLQTTLVDSRTQPGGQYYARPAGATWAAGLPEHLTEGLNTSRLDVRNETQVWGAFTGMAFGLAGPTTSEMVRARSVILATGAFEAPIPFPGWDRPGVVSAGAAQLILKESLAVPSGRTVVAGSGPFLLVVASLLADAGAQVTAVVEAVPTVKQLRMVPALAKRPSRAFETIRYLSRLRGVKIERGRRVLGVESGVLVCDGSRHRFDTLCVGHGFKPRLELARLLGCEMEGGAVRVDFFQRTSTPSVWAAGELTGIGGAELAHCEGRVAGLAVAQDLDRLSTEGRGCLASWARRRRAAAGFASALRSVFPQQAPLGAANDATAICLCESVTLGEMRRLARVAPERDVARTLKALLRCGMGPCQGLMCWDAVEAVAADRPEGHPQSRMPVGVVTVGALANPGEHATDLLAKST
jgi:NADPH-dependent 2,4-dienoyl-CoA reductase/sulfur reductase-like enzyme